METLKLNDITIQYDENKVLEHFNLVISKNDLLVILGPSGCGKSTLLHAIAGLLLPSQGEILFDGKPVFSADRGQNTPAEKRGIGFVFQDYSLWPHMSVSKNIAYPLKVKKYSKKAIDQKVNALLESVDLLDKKDAFPAALSGGEKQRVAIARAMAADPVLMLLDEPLANIDAALKTQLLSLISKLKIDLDIPMIFVTHDQKEAFEIATRMVVMESGKIIQEGCPRHIYKFPENKFVAGFVGENNLIESRCLSRYRHRRGREETLAIRPEDIRISDIGEYTGQIEKIVYKGSYSSLHVQLDNTRVIINVTDDQYHPGDTVRFDIQRTHALSACNRP